MTPLTINIPDETFSQLKELADDALISIEQVVNNMIQAGLEDEDTPDEEIIYDIRQALKEDLAGDVRPLEDVLDELRQELMQNANKD
ncbi:MAG: hypothetical protein MUE54_08935 [Anaerolineae bacterium]|nr:hypothetical protein [Anaerolineae bacterium]